MAQKDGDYFRVARLGGFRKDDVMAFVEQLQRQLHEQSCLQKERDKLLREARRGQLRWMNAARQQHKRGSAAAQVAQELVHFQRQLIQAQGMLAEIERENYFLREKIRVLEEDPKPEETASVPLDQLTFQLFLDSLGLGDGEKEENEEDKQ